MTPSTKNTILLFTRYPHPGKCKTRLLPKYSAEAAATIHRQLVAHSDKTIRNYLALHKKTTYTICYTGASVKEMHQWLGKKLFTEQQGANLGKRMATALTTALKSSEKCLLMGSDCPGITPELLENSFTALQEKDIVLGPAYDGGYYLVAMNNTLSKKQIEYCFADIPWGSDKVLATTVERIKELQLLFHLLPKLHDIDTPDDIYYFDHYSHAQ